MRLRRIAHVDLDAFYASVEQRDDASLRGRPVAVGGKHRGVVMAASYEARVYGVCSAMPVARARQLCPGLVTVPPRFEAYAAASDAFHDVLAAVSGVRDRVGLDEAYLDLSHRTERAAELGAAIRAAVADATALTASVGLSTSKFVAKVASAHQKPDGLTVVPPREVVAFLAALPLERFHGVGPATAGRLRRLGLRTGADLQRVDPDWLGERLGRTGRWLAQLGAGRDDRQVGVERDRKSAGAERTFFDPLRHPADVERALAGLSERVEARLARLRLVASTVTLKVRSPAFETLTRQATLDAPVWTAGDLARIGGALLAHPAPPFQAYRLLGALGLLARTWRGARRRPPARPRLRRPAGHQPAPGLNAMRRPRQGACAPGGGRRGLEPDAALECHVSHAADGEHVGCRAEVHRRQRLPVEAAPIAPTALGQRMVAQARHVLAEAERLEDRSADGIWLLREGRCFRHQALALIGCGGRGEARAVPFESGNLGTLQRLVDRGYGMTLSPGLAVQGERSHAPESVRSFRAPAPSRTVRLMHAATLVRRHLVGAFAAEVARAAGPALPPGALPPALPPGTLLHEP